MLQLCGVLIICALVTIIICLANRSGKQAARLKELKRELESISRAQELAANVYSMPDNIALGKLHDIANKQRSDMSDSKF